jgi:hypothetical protein
MPWNSRFVMFFGLLCGWFVCAGVAEWLGSGLQLNCVGGDPLMLVRIRPPAPDYCLVVC